MKKRGLKFLKRFSLIALALYVIGILSVNLYLQSEGSRAHLRRIVEGRFGSKAEIGSISYLPFRGVTIKRIKVRQRDDVEQITDEPFFRVDSIHLQIDTTTVFSRPIEIRRITVKKPVITIHQDLEGALALPWIKPGLVAPQIIVVNPDDQPVPPVPQPAPQPPPAPVPPPKKPPRFKLQEMVMQDGELRIATADGRHYLADFTGMNAEIQLPQTLKPNEKLVLGQLSIGETQLMKFFRASNLKSDIRFDAPFFAFPRIQGQSDGGTLEASLLLNWSQPGIPFELKSKVQNVSLDQLARRGSSRLSFSSGHLQGELQVGGYLQAIESLRGSGTFEAVDARLSRNALLESLGRYLSLEEFVEVNFDTAETDFRLKGPNLMIHDLHVKTNNLEFRGFGSITLSQQLNLAARLYFSQRMYQLLQRIERQLPEAMVRRVDQLEGRDDYYRDFMIGGNLDSPRADFIGGESRSFEEMMNLMKEATEGSSGDPIP